MLITGFVPRSQYRLDHWDISQYPRRHPMFAMPISIHNIVMPGTDKTWSLAASADGYGFDMDAVAETSMGEQIMERLEPGDRRWFQYKRRKCQAAQVPPYPFDVPPWLPELEHRYRHASAKRQDGSLVCPHKQTPLDNLGTYDGCVECPLHGLRWDADTGALVPWPEAQHLEDELEDAL